jgi:hypothetical protein
VFDDDTESAIDRAFALLLVAAQLLSPLGWVYYLWLPAGPIAALAVRRSRSDVRWFSVRGLLGLVTIFGFVAPLPVLFSFQPRGWASVSFASAYFWATLSVWILLLLDFTADLKVRTTSSLDS